MSIPATWRAQQTSSTAGTGTLTLNAAPANRIAFATSLGAVSQAVHYSLSVAGTNQWEIGVGTYNGGSPGTLTRSTVLASSNSGLLVSFSGTIDVILAAVPGQRPRATFTGSATEALIDLGNLLTFTGSSTATRTLPAVASVPLGAGYLYRNAGTAGAALILDPSGSETINGLSTLTIFGGESVEIFATAAGWEATGLPAMSLVRTQTASASAQLDFVLPAGFTEFELRFSNVTPANDGAVLAMRTSVDSGASFAAGASDYFFGFLIEGTASNGTASAMQMTYSLDTASSAISTQGTSILTIGSASRRPTLFTRAGGGVNNVTAQYGLFSSSCARNATAAVNAIRFLMDTGNIATGTFSLYAVR